MAYFETNYFVNYKNGSLSIDNYRLPDATLTDFDDLVLKADGGYDDEILTASLDNDKLYYQEQVISELKNKGL